MVKHARKSVDHERAIGFTMHLHVYAGCSFPSNTWHALSYAGHVELLMLIHGYIFMIL